MAFSQDHERICAIEWLVQRLAVDHCMRSADPLAEAQKIVDEGQAYGDLMYTHASRSGNVDHSVTALSIAGAVATLVEHLPMDVQTTLDHRAAHSSG